MDDVGGCCAVKMQASVVSLCSNGDAHGDVASRKWLPSQFRLRGSESRSALMQVSQNRLELRFA